ncbi:MAG: cytochrome b [Hahellaceae bacterium]|nr:cytochrome b [Hahellaceae bacterium]
MKLGNSSEQWGGVSIAIHWLVALTIFGMFGLGLYMVELSYYDPWYKSAPWLHKSVGALLFVVMLARLAWRRVSGVPRELVSHKTWEVKLAHWVHGTLYLIIFLIIFSGYLIVTAKGSGLSVFGWFEIPSLISDVEHLEDMAGDIHRWLAYFLMALVTLHAAGALKHHFIDRDVTLTRMLGIGAKAAGRNEKS